MLYLVALESSSLWWRLQLQEVYRIWQKSYNLSKYSYFLCKRIEEITLLLLSETWQVFDHIRDLVSFYIVLVSENPSSTDLCMNLYINITFTSICRALGIDSACADLIYTYLTCHVLLGHIKGDMLHCRGWFSIGSLKKMGNRECSPCSSSFHLMVVLEKLGKTWSNLPKNSSAREIVEFSKSPLGLQRLVHDLFLLLLSYEQAYFQTGSTFSHWIT